jgi:predicted butyrate kinase (DUF1464 family)
MPRVIGIDPGTLTVDLCGLDDGRLFLDVSLPTSEALADPSTLLGLIEDAHQTAPVDLVAGPSGYGLPLVTANDLQERDIRLACLAPAGEPGGIGGLGAFMRALRTAHAPVVFTPGVIHLASVPAHRKVNRVDMGTADKVCAVLLAFREHCERRQCAAGDASFVFLELGGAFTAAIAIEQGRIVDGLGGTSGPIGARAAGALDGEVAFLAGSVSKQMLFSGGAETVAGGTRWTREIPAGAAAMTRDRLAREAYLEAIVKAVAVLRASAVRADEVVLSGRLASDENLAGAVTRLLGALRPEVTCNACVVSRAGQAMQLKVRR